MAQCKLTPHEYIQNAFAPQVAILCSEDADNLCLKNNLRFVELIQPFCRLNNEIRIADPSGNTVPIRNLRVVFEDMNRRPPQPTLGKKLLSEVVTNTPWDRPTIRTIGASGTRGALELELQPTTRWYEAWRDTFLHIQYPSDHEFTKHYLACVLVVASNSDSPLDQLNRLSQYLHQQLHQTPSRYPKWFSPNILKYYLLVHDVTVGDLTKSEQVLEQMSSMYGAGNCHMLQINSRPLDHSDIHLPDPWTQFLVQRASCDPSGGSSSETSSGTGTPREDVSGLPTRVTEGDTTDCCEPVHPLSPPPTTVPTMDEKNGAFDIMPGVEISSDVPVMVDRPTQPPGTPQHHGGCLTSSDVDRIRIFVHEFCVRSLIPHTERQIRHLNDVVTNRSRSKSLLSATRRWLVGNKSPGAATNSVIYSSEATELQTRRLADLCFMFGLYELAYSFYHTAKNDFKSDQAWLYFAGAQEMAALAAFMHNSADYPKRYLHNSLHTYLNVCKVYNFAIRATILSGEVLKHCGEYGEAAMTFIKLTSEESDLLSALMLEQAAHCFIHAQRPLPRKYAFHMTLAGHRYSKAGQRAHSLRSYKQAFQVYASRGWVLAEDHIHFTLGKQAQHLKQLSEGLTAYTQLVDQKLKHEAPSQQSPSQQITYVREFINTFHQYVQQDWEPSMGLPYLPLPMIDSQATRVLLGAAQDKPTSPEWTPASHVSLDSPPAINKRWFALEKELVTGASGTGLKTFRPNLQLLTSETPNTQSPVVPSNEPVTLEVLMTNPLAVSLDIADVKLVFTFMSEGEDGDDSSSAVYHSPHAGFTLPAGAQELVRLELLPKLVGKILIQGVQYKLSLTPDPSTGAASTSSATAPVVVEGQQGIKVQGPRLNSTTAEKCGAVYAKDNRLDISVLPPLSRLSVTFHGIPQIMSCGEMCSTEAIITNVGPCSVSKLCLAVSDPNHVYMETHSTLVPEKSVCVLSDSQSVDSRINSRVETLTLPDNELKPGESIRAKLWLHAPLAPGAFEVELLFYYDTSHQTGKNKYRLLRHHESIYVEKSLSLKVTSAVSQNLETSLTQDEKEDANYSYTSNLVLEALNISEVDSSCQSYKVVGLSSNSKKWAVVPHARLKVQELRVGESCHMCIKGVQHINKKKGNMVLSKYPFEGGQTPGECWWRFSLRTRVSLPDLLADPLPPNPTADHIPPPPTQAQLDTSYITEANTLDTVITIWWKSERGGQMTYGEHSVHLKSLGESVIVPSQMLVGTAEEEKPPIRIIPESPTQLLPSLIPPPAKQRNLVKVSAQFPGPTQHDFLSDKLCCLEFVLSLHNCTGCNLITFLNLSQDGLPASSGGGSSQMYSPQASTQLLYVGGTARKVSLPPWGNRQVPIRALITCPGSYSLGSFTLTAIRQDAGRDKTEQPTPQLCQIQTAVTVMQTTRERQTHDVR
ncbi:hypothetical protein Pmani_019075 [Petrolisthes manimaculis]|uniref:Trafficking protein particle complex subunit 8 n=1 Tax=Petrolisthes manimaculis TaxID=1843537 RepID=A0AAE1PJ37_9EUCA|nr:hypothetical protein Pmani_019075 [Petrolisthes manimaculis]